MGPSPRLVLKFWFSVCSSPVAYSGPARSTGIKDSINIPSKL